MSPCSCLLLVICPGAAAVLQAALLLLGLSQALQLEVGVLEVPQVVIHTAQWH